MPSISAVLLPDHLEQPVLRGRVAVVIDVLRATTTIARALHNGASSITPVASVDAARLMAHDRHGAILCGERGGIKPEGFELGNSPRSYSRDLVTGKDLVLTTTNGTRALHMATHAAEVYTGSITNLSILSDALMNDQRDIMLVCSGTDRRPSFEDSFCAGLIVDRLLDSHEPDDSAITLHHAAVGAISTYGSIKDAVASSFHAHRLMELGFDQDIDEACENDSTPCVPCFDPATGEIRPHFQHAKFKA